jgi:poly(A) polymerase
VKNMFDSVEALIRSTPSLIEVLQTLEDDGHTAHLVGGAVRNALMGEPVKDLDIATSAHPEIVAALFEDKGFSVHPTGIEHGTLTVVVDDEPFEITTWRQDVATDGRRATIAFADTLADDAHRRDFTINALYADRHGRVLDPTGQGLSDAIARKVRFIDDAETRIREDALRILRYFRFTGGFTGGPDSSSDDFAACARLAHLTTELSAERIGQEMGRILGFKDASHTLVSMQNAGVLPLLLPKMGREALTRLADLEAHELAWGLEPCSLRRLVLLCKEAPKEELCLSRADTHRHRQLRRALESGMNAAELGYRLGKADGEDVLVVAAALNDPRASIDALNALRDAAGRTCPVRGKDLLSRFQGPALGAALSEAEAIWIASDFSMSQDALLSALATKD